MAVMATITADIAREAARTDGGRFGIQEHTAPEAQLIEPDGETPEMAEERGIADARALRTANPGFYADEYMTGYESELLDIGDSWED